MTRVKRVFSNHSDVIHAFAQKQQESGRASNVYFEKTDWNDSKFGKSVDYGTRLYSYGSHYLLAEFLDENTVMVNDQGYSSSTGKHIGIARWATSQFKQFFLSNCDIEHVYNFVKSNVDKLANARKPEIYVNPILYRIEQLDEYLIWAKKITSAKRNAKYRELKRILASINTPEYKAKLKELRLKELAKIKERVKIDLKRFENYEINSFRIGKEDYLRVSQDGTKVETTQYVSVSIEAARVLYKCIEAGRDIKGHYIDGYRVTSLNGTLVIGCHNINMDSVHKVGKQIS